MFDILLFILKYESERIPGHYKSKFIKKKKMWSKILFQLLTFFLLFLSQCCCFLIVPGQILFLSSLWYYPQSFPAQQSPRRQYVCTAPRAWGAEFDKIDSVNRKTIHNVDKSVSRPQISLSFTYYIIGRQQFKELILTSSTQCIARLTVWTILWSSAPHARSTFF